MDNEDRIAELVKRDHISMTCRHLGSSIVRDTWHTTANTFRDDWTCTLRFAGHRLTTPFHMGSGHNGKAPTVDMVLDALLLDANSVNEARDFEDWCANMGYEKISEYRAARQAYNACVRIGERLEKFLGPVLYVEYMYGECEEIADEPTC